MKNILFGIVIVAGIALAWWYFALPPLNKPVQTDNSAQKATIQTIEIKNFTYSPESVTTNAGEKITFRNKDLAGHSLTADDGSFDTGIVSQNGTKTFTAPAKPGSYKFHCTPHPSITGTLIVK